MEKTELEENLIRAISLRKATLQEALINWGECHYRHFPWREKRTPYSVLISEILLKRTTASAVNPRGPRPEHVALVPRARRVVRFPCRVAIPLSR